MKITKDSLIKDFAEKCIDKILYDLTDRRGFRQTWDKLDDDIKDEIKEAWQQVIIEQFSK